ncbi:hypothetical protein [Mesorhizobium sp. ES1-4]|uniref:hypothetical protein n=1 Tax=Mesorhizobium sp. ES1-4 TaxID=2876627 RepID=UPI001CCAF4EE|nr:hypothetical protein [Mesorhizobium sp. ES1-4]MBZ9798706.1 hypothetical protein [Mesorhizobium sp. ES1-4]
MSALDSGDPTGAICSTPIAQAFSQLSFRILSAIDIEVADRPDRTDSCARSATSGATACSCREV